MNFKRGGNAIKQLGVGRSVLDELMDHPTARPINDPRKDIKDKYSHDYRVWINPHNQHCFNAMWCTEQDLIDWMNGTGSMVMGNNDEEKKKYWDLAAFEEEIEFGWSIYYHWKWFDQFTTDYNPHAHSNGYGISHQIQTPLKLNKKNPEETIKAMFVPYVAEMARDMEFRTWENIRREAEKEWYGIKRTLYCLGIGYMGACNTPEEIQNLNWVTGIIEAKAYYTGLLKTGRSFPDFAWLLKKKEDKYRKDKEL